jgi:hypothetical protein
MGLFPPGSSTQIEQTVTKHLPCARQCSGYQTIEDKLNIDSATKKLTELLRREKANLSHAQSR